MSTREKMCRLTAILRSRFEEVVGADLDIDLFLPVPVHVPEVQADRAVWIRLPAFIHRGNILPIVPAGIRQGYGCGRRRLRLLSWSLREHTRADRSPRNQKYNHAAQHRLTLRQNRMSH